jgi:hypothetical protein
LKGVCGYMDGLLEGCILHFVFPPLIFSDQRVLPIVHFHNAQGFLQLLSSQIHISYVHTA